MAVTFIRTVVIFTTLIVIMRFMGKRQIGEMQPFEFVVTLIIADLACIPMTDVSIPLVYGIVSILGLFILHQIFSLLEQSGDFVKHIISGKPSLVINKNGVDIKELKRNNMGIEDLLESMRAQGYFSLDDLDYAIFESNGKLSALENTDLKSKGSSVPLLVVNEGKINKNNVNLLKLNEEKIVNIIKSNGGSLKSTDVLTVDGNGRVYFQQRNKKFNVFNVTLPEGVQW